MHIIAGREISKASGVLQDIDSDQARPALRPKMPAAAAAFRVMMTAGFRNPIGLP